MPLSKAFIYLLLALLFAGCKSQGLPVTDKPEGRIQHIVVVWLREPGNQAHRERLLETSQQLTQIPGVISVVGGTVVPGDREVIDSSFDVALIFTLKDQQTLRQYVHHPLHQKLLEEVFRPLIERYRVYDVEGHLFGQ
jgi:hypothetical protein